MKKLIKSILVNNSGVSVKNLVALDLENNPELAEQEDNAAEIAAEFWWRS